MDERMLVLQELNNEQKPTGRFVAFADVEFLPLQYSDLIGKTLDSTVVIPLNWCNAKVAESNISGLSVGNFASANSTLESSYTSKAIALVKGGWLPSGLAIKEDIIIFPDRCTISELMGRFEGGVKKNKANKDFLNYFSDPGIRINPSLYVLEGNLRKNPSSGEIKQQFEEVMAKLRSALPEAELLPVDSNGLQGIAGIAQDTQASMERKEHFLWQLAPILEAPTSVKNKDKLWDKILATAQEYGLTKTTLVVVAALSAISISKGINPAKNMLKFKSGFTRQDAYNALADLRSLEFLMCLFALYPNQRIALCTGDKNLALFWAGIRASNFVWLGDHVGFTLSPLNELMPSMTEAQRRFFFDI